MAIGLAAALILMKVIYRKDNAIGKSGQLSSMMPAGNDSIKNKVREYLAENKKIEAIKFVRENTGADLLESKNYVDHIEMNVNTDNGIFRGTTGNSDKVNELEINISSKDKILLEKIEALLKNQKKLDAIKLLVSEKKTRLIDAKNMVEAMEEKLKKQN